MKSAVVVGNQMNLETYLLNRSLNRFLFTCSSDSLCARELRENAFVGREEVLWAACIILTCTTNVPGQTPPALPTIFDAAPNHLWNRTYACLLMRQSHGEFVYGADALDPPLWWQTRYLLIGESHRRALTCLDELLHGDIEHAMQDPLKQAVIAARSMGGI